MVVRRLVWNLLAAVLFLVIAIVVPIPAWARAVIVVGAVLELGMAALMEWVRRRLRQARR